MRFHLFHDWSKWEEVNKVCYYDYSNGNKRLVKTNLILQKKCVICDLVKVKEIRYQGE